MLTAVKAKCYLVVSFNLWVPSLEICIPQLQTHCQPILSHTHACSANATDHGNHLLTLNLTLKTNPSCMAEPTLRCPQGAHQCLHIEVSIRLVQDHLSRDTEESILHFLEWQLQTVNVPMGALAVFCTIEVIQPHFLIIHLQKEPFAKGQHPILGQHNCSDSFSTWSLQNRGASPKLRGSYCKS